MRWREEKIKKVIEREREKEKERESVKVLITGIKFPPLLFTSYVKTYEVHQHYFSCFSLSLFSEFSPTHSLFSSCYFDGLLTNEVSFLSFASKEEKKRNERIMLLVSSFA